MKKFFTNPKVIFSQLLIAGSLLFSGNADAQSFKISPEKTIKKTFALVTDYHDINVYIRNITPNEIQLKWKKLVNTLETNNLKWDYSLCDNVNCYAGVPDGAVFLATPANDSAYLKLTITITEGQSMAGSGLTQLLVYNAADSTDADTITFMTDVVTGVLDMVQNDGNISIYPNPAADIINISSADLNLGKGSISIYNALGAKVEDIKLTAAGMNSVPVNALPTGVYYIRFQSSTGEIATKSFLKR